MFQTIARIAFVILVLLLLLALFPAFWPILTGGTRGEHIREQKHYAALFRAGNTNAPLLAMDWFSHGTHFCRVDQSGNGRYALDVGYAQEGGDRILLNATNKLLLIQAINQLPLQSKHFLPRERQVFISGIRSNQWFQCVYDRANVPPEVEKLYDLTGAYLEWFIPKVGSHPEGVNHSMSQHDANSFVIAKDASIAVSICANYGFQIWDLKEKSPVQIAKLDKLPYPWMQTANELWGVQTISPDGRIIVFAVRDVLFAVDWQNQKLLWQTNQMVWGNTYHAGNRVLAVGNNGRSLFIAEANCIEHWDLATGTKVASLATNETGIKFMQTSWDGRFLLARFGDNSFKVWKTDKAEPVFQFSEPEQLASVALSPDGQKIILSTWEQRGKFVLWDWQRKKREEFPLRTPYASHSAYSICWAPDGKRVAAEIDTYPSSLIIYDTISWKPVADWPCGAVGSGSQYVFNKEGILFQLMDGEVNSLDMESLKSLTN